MFFPILQQQLDSLRAVDERMALLVEKAGVIEREVFEDLFTCMVYQIVSQQISSSALKTVWSRFVERFGETMDPDALAKLEIESIAVLGVSKRKAQAIVSLAEATSRGELDLRKLEQADDEEAIRMLTRQKGIGPWTAEMILLFGLKRDDVLSFGDFGIRKGLILLYGLDDLSREQFEQYRLRFSPNGSIASFCLWKLANGAVRI